jgi:hypothetical protein
MSKTTPLLPLNLVQSKAGEVTTIKRKGKGVAVRARARVRARAACLIDLKMSSSILHVTAKAWALCPPKPNGICGNRYANLRVFAPWLLQASLQKCYSGAH